MMASEFGDISRPFHTSSLPRQQKHQLTNEHRQVSQSVTSINTINTDNWKRLQNSVIYLFHNGRLRGRELDSLNEIVRNVLDSNMGRFMVDHYKETILLKGMIILRESVKEKSGLILLQKLSDIWRDFYKNILTTLQAIFYPVQEQGLSIRGTTLIGFRDIVLLKTKIEETLQNKEMEVPPDVKQMLLVLASVHDNTPPSESYLKIERLVSRVVTPYIGFNGLYRKESMIPRRPSSVTMPVDVKWRTVLGPGKRNQRNGQYQRIETFKKISEESIGMDSENTKMKRHSFSGLQDDSQLPPSLVDEDMLKYLHAGTREEYSYSCK